MPQQMLQLSAPDQHVVVVEQLRDVCCVQAGALLFFFGCHFAVVESINVDFEEKWHEWMQNDQQGEAPTLRLSPLASEGGKKEFLSYYGCLTQFVGSILFLVGAFSSLLYAHNLLPEDGVVGEYVW